jgi:hypothetical protein
MKLKKKTHMTGFFENTIEETGIILRACLLLKIEKPFSRKDLKKTMEAKGVSTRQGCVFLGGGGVTKTI